MLLGARPPRSSDGTLTRSKWRCRLLGEAVHWEATMKVTGGCHCGHILYEAEVDPATVRVCHCTDCQKLTGTAFRTNIASLPGTFRLKSGAPKTTSRPPRAGTGARAASARIAARRSIPPRPSQTPQLTGCGSEGFTSVRNLRHRSGRLGGVRRCSGRWIYAVWSGQSGSETAGADCVRARHSAASQPAKSPSV